MAEVQLWGRVKVVGPDSTELARFVLEGQGRPDLSTVDRVARLALSARRLGCRVVLADVSPALRSLLDLSGLRVEVQGQAEIRKESLRVQEGQEECHPGDL